MKYILRLLAPIACLFVFASCSNDPVSTTGSSHFTPEYHPTLVSMEGYFSGVCRAGADIYAAGSAILRYDGKRWGPIAAPAGSYGPFRSIIGFPDGRVVVSGAGTFVLDNGNWQDISDPRSYTDELWGSSPDNLYAINYRSLRHFDGTSWSTVTLPQSQSYLYTIAGRASDDIVVSGEYGTLFRFDGTQWTSTTIDSSVSYGSLAMDESGRLFGSSYREVYDLTGGVNHLILRAVMEGPRLYVDGDVLYAGGALTFDRRYFLIERYKDNLWSKVALDRGNVNTLWAGGDNVVAGGDDNFIWRGYTSGGGNVETPCPVRGNFRCAASIDGAVFTGGRDMFRYENGVWTNLNKQYVTQDDIVDIAGLRRDDVYALTDHMLLHYDGSVWTWVSNAGGHYANAVWVEKNSDVWVGDNEGQAYRLHGNTWAPDDLGLHGHAIYDVWGDDDVMVTVGSGGAASIRKDGVWHYIPTGSTHSLVAVWGFNQNYIFAADSYDHQIFAYNGHEWKETPLDISDSYMLSIWGTSPANVFATGSRGSVMHFDGNSWKPLERVIPGDAGVLCGTTSEVMGLGYTGAVSYRR